MLGERLRAVYAKRVDELEKDNLRERGSGLPTGHRGEGNAVGDTQICMSSGKLPARKIDERNEAQ